MTSRFRRAVGSCVPRRSRTCDPDGDIVSRGTHQAGTRPGHDRDPTQQRAPSARPADRTGPRTTRRLDQGHGPLDGGRVVTVRRNRTTRTSCTGCSRPPALSAVPLTGHWLAACLPRWSGLTAEARPSSRSRSGRSVRSGPNSSPRARRPGQARQRNGNPERELQPVPSRVAASSAVSTPSATTPSPRRLARPTTVSITATRLWSRSWTKLSSIFSPSMGETRELGQ